MRPQVYLLILISLFLNTTVNAQDIKKEQVKWVELSKAIDMQTESKKTIMVFFYTNWCKFCKMMESDVFKNDKAVKYINEYFIPVRLNAETKDTINVQKRTFVYNTDYKINEIALYLLDGKLSYPSTVFLLPDNKKQRIPGYLDIVHAEWLYRFFGEKKYETISFEDFMNTHKSSW